MLSEPEIALLRSELLSSERPLFFYDDDPDGLCAFLVLYKFCQKGKGVMLKSVPNLDISYLRKVDEFQPDKIIALDIPKIDEDFLQAVKVPLFWIDHHQPVPVSLPNIHYSNPRVADPHSYVPTSSMAFQVSERDEDMWIATIGTIYDWSMPYFIDRFVAKYPHLLPAKKDLADAKYAQPLSVLISAVAFLLKGPSSDVLKNVKILSRIRQPEEILQQTTSAGRYLYKYYEKINKEYRQQLEDAKNKVTRSKMLIYYYSEKKWAFTADLANELITLYPQKIVIIVRHKGEQMKCSLRAKVDIHDALERALVGIKGYGGGHEQACGAVIHEQDWDRFLENFKKEMK